MRSGGGGSGLRFGALAALALLAAYACASPGSSPEGGPSETGEPSEPCAVKIRNGTSFLLQLALTGEPSTELGELGPGAELQFEADCAQRQVTVMAWSVAGRGVTTRGEAGLPEVAASHQLFETANLRPGVEASVEFRDRRRDDGHSPGPGEDHTPSRMRS